jgi:Tfp pilus assembly protein PilO
MDNLQKVRKKFTIVLGVLGMVDLLLLGYLLWPGSSYSALQERQRSLQQQRDALETEVKPLRGMDKQLEKTRGDVKAFYLQKIPSRFSDISQHLDKLRQENGVDIPSIHYSPDKAEKTDLPDVQRISIDTTVTGDYAKVAKFINAMEQDHLVFIITQVQLTGRDAGTVSLQIKFDAFLKEAA